jgi:SPX domain protein involved in polyphosphate accumulation
MKAISDIRKWFEAVTRPIGVFRYERKFVVGRLNIYQLEGILKRHPALFREIYRKRKINNIYLDTFDLKTYFDNVYGNSNRIKVRIRWYGETFGPINTPKLEFKIKSGLAGRKRIYTLSPFTLDKNFSNDTLAGIFNASDLPDWVREKLKKYRPALLNSYERKYFVSDNKKVRVTLDENMTYYGISSHNNNFIKKKVERQNVIVEMKYDPDSAFIASDISQHLPMRMTKSSKYINGIEIFNPHLST